VGATVIGADLAQSPPEVGDVAATTGLSDKLSARSQGGRHVVEDNLMVGPPAQRGNAQHGIDLHRWQA
jgi:hypothetical protein